MDNYFLVKWKEEIIGILARIDGTYYTRFQTSHLKNDNIGEEIIKQTSFQSDILYKNPELFDFFKRRIKLNPDEDEFDRIRKTGAKRPTDNFWLQEMNKEQAESWKKMISDILELEKRKEGIEDANTRD